MQVITLTSDKFERECGRLAMLVAGNHPKAFDAAVAIRTGGVWVADSMSRALHKGYFGEMIDVTLQRPSTKKKEGLIDKLLPHLPIPVLDLMRMAEAQALNISHRISKTAPLPEVTIPNRLAAILSEREAPEILIIDDAVDSGVTLAAVRRAIASTNPAAKVKSAVITVTTDHPRLRPDFSLYSNHTLIRFPWSKDFRR